MKIELTNREFSNVLGALELAEIMTEEAAPTKDGLSQEDWDRLSDKNEDDLQYIRAAIKTLKRGIV